MSTVSWNARDQLGRVIEVTSDTVADVPSPGPESLAVGGEQTIRRVGPYTLDFDYANVNSEPEFFGDDLPVGSIVLRAFGFVTVPFAPENINPLIQIVVGTANDYPVLSWNADPDLSGVPDKVLLEINVVDPGPPTVNFTPPSALIIGTGQKLGAVIWHDSGSLSGGSVDVYALIVEPAA